jgi:hypothetical protein
MKNNQTIDSIINKIIEQELVIRQEHDIEQTHDINDDAQSKGPGKLNIFLKNGLVGKCLFLFWYSNYTKDTKYRDLAYDMFSVVQQKMDVNNNLSFNNGLLGIAFSCAYSIENKYVLGDIDETCKVVDDLMYAYVARRQDSKTFLEEALTFVLDYMLYLTYRLEISFENRTERIVYIKFLTYWFNKVYQTHSLDFFEEPSPESSRYNCADWFVLISRMYQLNIERERLLHILDELKHRIMYKIPYLMYNRVVYLCALKEMSKIVPLDSDWTEYVKLVEKSVSISQLVNEETDARNLFEESGLVGLYAWLKYVNRNGVIVPIPYQDILSKCEAFFSSYYADLANEEHYIKEGLYGRLGLIMMYYDIKNKI